MKNILKIVMIIIGTLIGAGFASGREIYLFFMRYGNLGKIGIAVSAILTGIIIYSALRKVKENNVTDYNELLKSINPKHKKMNKLMSGIVNLFLLISFYIMVAGFSSYINQAFKVPNIISSIIFILLCYFIFLKSLSGMVKVNEILVPILIIFITYLGIKNISYLWDSNAKVYIETLNKGWLISSIFYASYNSIILVPVLSTLKDCINNKKEIFLISIFSSLFILVLSFIIYGLLLKGQFYVSKLELPLIQVALEYGNIFKYLYGFIIIISIFTSAISAGYSFLKNVSSNKKIYKLVLIFMCVSSVLISPIGFSKLVEVLYPFFGLLGLIPIIYLLNFKSNNINNVKLLEKNLKN